MNTLEFEMPKYRYCNWDQLQQSWADSADKFYYFLSVVYPIKPLILFTIIKHKNVFLNLATGIPKGSGEELSFFLLHPLIRVCPDEKCWGKCIPYSPAMVGLSSVLWELRKLIQPPPPRDTELLLSRARENTSVNMFTSHPAWWKDHRWWSEFDSHYRFKWPGKKFNKRENRFCNSHRLKQDRLGGLWRSDVEFNVLICKQSFVYSLSHPTTLKMHHTPKKG